MGLVKAFKSSVSSFLADQWEEYFYCDAMSSDVLVQKGSKKITKGSSNTSASDNIISDGSKIAVNEGQCMLIVENGKVVDFTAEAGAYEYHTGTEPSLFDSGLSGLKDSFLKVGKRFTFGGQPENDQRVYYVNMKEIMDNKVGVGDVPFRDSEFGFTMKLKGYGAYSYKITNPIMFYTNVCANVTDRFTRNKIDDQLKAEVQHNLQPALGKIALKGIAYDQLPLYTNEIADMLNQELNKDWTELRGITVVSVAFASITPDDESAKKIAQFQESRVYTNASMMGARLGGAQANAMESAAKNSAGAMTGFMGMGFAQQAGGATPAQFFEMGQAQGNQQVPQQPVPQQQAPQMPQEADNQVAVEPVKAEASDSWTCECGNVNTGKFCTNCGNKKPENTNQWVCSCGHVNEGKFCSECGSKKPEVELKACPKCGAEFKEGKPKFCPECGEKID